MRTEATSGGGAGSAAVVLGVVQGLVQLSQTTSLWDSGWWSETAATAALAAPHAGAAGAAGAAVSEAGGAALALAQDGYSG